MDFRRQLLTISLVALGATAGMLGFVQQLASQCATIETDPYQPPHELDCLDMEPLLACCKTPCVIRQGYSFNECDHQSMVGPCDITETVCRTLRPHKVCAISIGSIPDCDNCTDTHRDPFLADWVLREGICIPCDCYTATPGGIAVSRCCIGDPLYFGHVNAPPLESCCREVCIEVGCLDDECTGVITLSGSQHYDANCDCAAPCP